MENKPLSILIAASIALVLQTKHRITDNIGLGEIGLLVFIALAIASCFASPSKSPGIDEHPMPITLCAYLLATLIPTTALNVLYSTAGSDFRDLQAYMLCALLVFSLARYQTLTRNVSVLTVFFSLAIIAYHYFLGEDRALHSSMRFAAGAKNPNQLALYVACLILLTAIHMRGTRLKVACTALLVFFGLASASDAFNVYILAALATLALTFVVPHRFMPIIAPLVLIAGSTLCVFFMDEISDLVTSSWASADEGGARVTLYINGIRAWLDTPLTLLIGNGAGSFSGMYGPFQGAEAHNTPIDVLSMGGLVGLAAIYFFPVKGAVELYRLDQRLVLACTVGLLVFSLFHFVARHPIFWFTIFALLQHLKEQKEATQACVA